MTTYDFGTGNTNPETFPTDEFVKAAERAIRKSAVALNVYPGMLGHEGLRQLMAERESEREGVPVNADSLILTNGSMQAVTLAAEVLARRGDPVVMEEFNYVGTINAYKNLGIDMVGVPLDADGMRMDALDETLTRLEDEGRPAKFIYTLASYQNPTGSMMPRARREEMVEIARRHEAIIVEDNCYGDVHYEGEKPPAFYALDDSERMIYICSLSKIFAPGVRLGYVMARGRTLARLAGRRNDAGPNTLAAAIVTEYLGEGRLWPHVEMANAALKAKRDAMFEALESTLGNVCTWSQPVGGLFIWVKLPDEIDLDRLEALAAERDVAYAPGRNFQIHNENVKYIRLAFGFPPVEVIREGIPVLASCIRDACR